MEGDRGSRQGSASSGRGWPGRSWAVSLALPLLVSACAHYTASGGLVGGIRTVAVPVAANATADFRIAEQLSERLVDAYTRDGQLRVVDEDRADAVMHLNVEAVDDAPFTYTAAEVTEQYRFRVLVGAELVRSSDEEVLLRLERLEGWSTYDASLPDDQGRDPALVAALDMLIEEILDRTTAGW